MDVFSQFASTRYYFLLLNKGGILGNSVNQTFQATGVFKTRDGVQKGDTIETVDSDATLHVRPDESFILLAGANMVGHGIRAADYEGGSSQDYRIIGQRPGRNFQTGQVEFYYLTLKREKLVGSGESGS
jgi:hypothetical protein